MFSHMMVPMVYEWALWASTGGTVYWAVAGGVCALVCFLTAINGFYEKDTGAGLMFLVLTPVAFFLGFFLLPVVGVACLIVVIFSYQTRE